MDKIKQAFIFAAGRGERMRPITDKVPKPLIKVKGKAMIDHIIDKIDALHIVVNGSYLADLVEEHLNELNDPRIVFSKEEKRLETGGGLLFALKNGLVDENEPILLVNGDILWDGDEAVKQISEEFLKRDCDILLGLTKTKDYFGYRGDGDFDLSEDGKVEKGSEWSFVGVQILNPRILRFAPKDCDGVFSLNYFYRNAKELGIKVDGVGLDGEFFHVGDVEALEGVEQM